MQYHISDKIAPLKPSAIREIFKYAGSNDVISLAGGNPAFETLPVEDIRKLTAEVLEQESKTVLLYSQSAGHIPLRNALKDYLSRRHGFLKEYDDLMVTTGAQQCMDLTCKVLCNEGDTVICEDPSFIGSLNCFRSYNTNLVGIPMEEDGIHLGKLEEALKTEKNVRFIYLIPNFQNPTGITMSLEKRKAVYALAKQYDVMILEDNPYGDLRFEGEELPCVKSFDEDGRVVYAGSFSKILSTGIRVGYLVAPQELMAKLEVAKQCTDVHTSMIAQLLCHRFLTERDIDAHISGIKGVYAHKCGLMLKEMDDRFPKSVTYARPQGGLFLWVTLPEGMDGGEYATRLVKEHKVCVVPGSAFSVREVPSSRNIRLNFSSSTDEEIITGITKCAQLLKDML